MSFLELLSLNYFLHKKENPHKDTVLLKQSQTLTKFKHSDYYLSPNEFPCPYIPFRKK